MDKTKELKPVLVITHFKSEPKYISAEPTKWLSIIEEKFKDLEGYMIIWLFDGIHVLKIASDGKVADKHILSELSINLVKFRAFNKDKEWYVWRTGDSQFKNRFREDIKGDEKDIPCVDSSLTLRSVVAQKIQEFEAGKNTIGIKTRNYIGYENNLAGFDDYRFVEFI